MYIQNFIWLNQEYQILLFLFTVPFDEDDKDKSVWFLDHDYLENMYGMFKKVNGMYLLLHTRACAKWKVYI